MQKIAKNKTGVSGAEKWLEIGISGEENLPEIGSLDGSTYLYYFIMLVPPPSYFPFYEQSTMFI